jgi:hypothetical protein
MSQHHHRHHDSGASGSHGHHHHSDHTHSGRTHEHHPHTEGDGHPHGHHDLTGQVRHKLTGEYLDSQHLAKPAHRVGQHDGETIHISRIAEKDDGKPKTGEQSQKGLDTSKSVSDNVAAGTFHAPKDAKPDQSREGDAAIRDKAKEPVKNIDVVYQDQSGDKTRPKQDPDFRVKQDGTVEVLHNPDRTKSEKITVEVERPPGDRNAPPAAQQKAVDDLVGYLSGRYMPETKQPDGTVTRDGQIRDDQGLVSEKTKQSLHTKPSPDESLSPQARDQVHNVNRWHGSGGGRHHGDGGRFSGRQGGEQFGGRDVPRQPGEDDKLAAIKDVASGFFSRGEKEPYHTVRTSPERGHRVGRYGISHGQYMNWLQGLSDEEIEKLIKEGKLPKGALDVKNGKDSPEAKEFNNFLNKMKEGKEPLSSQDIDKFMPKQLQERMGTDLTKQYAFETADKDANGKPTRVNVGKIALSFELGHAATEEESKRPEYQQFMQAAEKAYPLALERQMSGGGAVDLTDAGRKITSAAHGSLGQALWLRHAADTQNGNLGCAASVSSVLRDAGVANVDELSVTGLAQNLRGKGWHAVPFNQRQPGDVIIALGSAGRHGHTGIVGADINQTYDNHSGSGRWSQDSAGYWTRGRWPVVYVLHPPGQ